MGIRRRTLLKAGGAAALAALPLPFLFRGRGALPSSLRADPEGLLDLAPGFSYRVIDREYSSMDDGYRVPALPDGMACFAGPAGSLVLMRNHEVFATSLLGPLRLGQKQPPEAYDSRCHGGVTRVVVDATTFERRSSNLVLTGTLRNCAGGPSPWGWLSCEETVDEGHGYVFLCSTEASQVQKPHKLPGYGRFKHEAACVDPRTLIAYLTEDRGDSCLYRFVPDDPRAPFVGRLQALRVQGRPGFDTGSAARIGERLVVEWVDVPEPDPKDDTVRIQAQERGAAIFRRGEGVWFHDGTVYVCSTSGGPASAGQVFRLIPGQPDTLELVTQSTDRAVLDCPDNITVAPFGDVVMAEDGGGDQFIRGLTSDGQLYDIARNAASSGEICGVCFSPDGRALFANLQREGVTLAITGPFAELSARAQVS
jgi:uncharacterized protein